MRVLVLGSDGCVGREVVRQALGHGHEVTAFGDRPLPGAEMPGLDVVRGDILDLDSLSAAVAGRDAVVSALDRPAPGRTCSLDACAASTVHAMALQQVGRLVAVSASGVFARSDSRLPFALRARIRLTQRREYDDLEAMERRIMASDLEWTIVRPVGLAEGPLTGVYRVSLDGSALPGASMISCADVAALVLKAVSGKTYSRRAVAIGY